MTALPTIEDVPPVNSQLEDLSTWTSVTSG